MERRSGTHSLTGFVCPRCRYRVSEVSEPFGVCPRDRFALVAATVLAGADGDPLLGMTVANRYVVLGKIGRGATGTVYRTFDTHAKRAVALKILRGDAIRDMRVRERIKCEARVLAMLSSPNTVRLLDVGEFVLEISDELSTPMPSFFLAMEMLEGEPLSKRLARVERLSVTESIRWASHALGSLADAHDKGVVHRDLTPNNLFLTRTADNEEVGKVVDFGLAVFAREVLPDGEAFAAIGTPRYMSPEQARGEALDGRSDLYSVGLLLYQMLTGKPPFTDGDAARVMARHVHDVPQPICVAEPNVGIPQWISDVVDRALAKDPKDRPQSAREFLMALDTASRG
jgi:eukaryotic-like serine/threonine-protein kinase